MKKTRNAVVALALALAAVSASASDVAAFGPDCTSDYMMCLNDVHAFQAVAREMGNIECGAGWLGCTAGKLRFW